MHDETRAFFGPRAATWDERFPDDGPAYARAAIELAPLAGGRVLDVGCGTGRALAHFSSFAVGIDVTPEMVAVAAAKRHGPVVIGDAVQLPLRNATIDAIFAAGLLTHVRDPHALLVELARVGTRNARLAVFHPIGRAALARRHGRDLRPDELLDAAVLPGVLAAAGWKTERIDDAADRYLALATR